MLQVKYNLSSPAAIWQHFTVLNLAFYILLRVTVARSAKCLNEICWQIR